MIRQTNFKYYVTIFVDNPLENFLLLWYRNVINLSVQLEKIAYHVEYLRQNQEVIMRERFASQSASDLVSSASDYRRTNSTTMLNTNPRTRYNTGPAQMSFREPRVEKWKMPLSFKCVGTFRYLQLIIFIILSLFFVLYIVVKNCQLKFLLLFPYFFIIIYNFKFATGDTQELFVQWLQDGHLYLVVHQTTQSKYGTSRKIWETPKDAFQLWSVILEKWVSKFFFIFLSPISIYNTNDQTGVSCFYIVAETWI